MKLQWMFSIRGLRVGCFLLHLTSVSKNQPIKPDKLNEFIDNSFHVNFPTVIPWTNAVDAFCMHNGTMTDRGTCICPPHTRGVACEFECASPFAGEQDFQNQCNVSTWADLNQTLCPADIFSYYSDHCLIRTHPNYGQITAVLTSPTAVRYTWTVPDGVWGLTLKIYFNIVVSLPDNEEPLRLQHYPEGDTSLLHTQSHYNYTLRTLCDSGSLNCAQLSDALHPFRQYSTCVQLWLKDDRALQYPTLPKRTNLTLGCTTFMTDEGVIETLTSEITLVGGEAFAEIHVSKADCNGFITGFRIRCSDNGGNSAVEFYETLLTKSDCRLEHDYVFPLKHNQCVDMLNQKKTFIIMVSAVTKCGSGGKWSEAPVVFASSSSSPWAAIAIALSAVVVVALGSILVFSVFYFRRLRRTCEAHRCTSLLFQERFKAKPFRLPLPPRRFPPRPPDVPDTEFEPTPVSVLSRTTSLSPSTVRMTATNNWGTESCSTAEGHYFEAVDKRTDFDPFESGILASVKTEPAYSFGERNLVVKT